VFIYARGVRIEGAVVILDVLVRPSGTENCVSAQAVAFLQAIQRYVPQTFLESWLSPSALALVSESVTATAY